MRRSESPDNHAANLQAQPAIALIHLTAHNNTVLVRALNDKGDFLWMAAPSEDQC